MKRLRVFMSFRTDRWLWRYWLWSALWMTPLVIYFSFVAGTGENGPYSQTSPWTGLVIGLTLILGAPLYTPIALAGLCLIAWFYGPSMYMLVAMGAGYTVAVTAITFCLTTGLKLARRKARLRRITAQRPA